MTDERMLGLRAPRAETCHTEAGTGEPRNRGGGEGRANDTIYTYAGDGTGGDDTMGHGNIDAIVGIATDLMHRGQGRLGAWIGDSETRFPMVTIDAEHDEEGVKLWLSPTMGETTNELTTDDVGKGAKHMRSLLEKLTTACTITRPTELMERWNLDSDREAQRAPTALAGEALRRIEAWRATHCGTPERVLTEVETLLRGIAGSTPEDPA